MNIAITIRPCVSADRGFAICLHTCDRMFKGLYSHGWPLRNASIKKHMLTYLFLTFLKAKKLVLVIWVS